ncbi:DUF1501 domain-containing protein [Methylophilus sp. 3sh_L]|uniref:DUF1501 domain-containing protein n=1 Tax=Methylophilus sp. 3sh_L TaxID=3377114 RepID=UPI00398E58B5
MHRRQFVKLCGAGLAAFCLPTLSFAAAATEQRFIFIIQRGAADGLNTVIPYADPDYQRLRGALAIEEIADSRLDSLFALHPSLVTATRLYQQQQALFVHAVASAYRERSHFDGQNVLESGGTRAYQLRDGWLNRLLGLLPPSQNEAIAFSPTIPLALRGSYQVDAYASAKLPQPSDDLLLRVSQLYSNDAQLHAAWESAMQVENMAGFQPQNSQQPEALGKLVGDFLSRADGPRIAMLETGGWDTHSAQNNRLSKQLSDLDKLIASLQTALGDHWQQTLIIVATEFGRTAAANGTGGTDHGTGAAMLAFGGALPAISTRNRQWAAGKVIADWPGLKDSQLYQGRDLQPTLGLDSAITALVSAHYGLEPGKVSRMLFPASS